MGLPTHSRSHKEPIGLKLMCEQSMLAVEVHFLLSCFFVCKSRDVSNLSFSWFIVSCDWRKLLLFFARHTHLNVALVILSFRLSFLPSFLLSCLMWVCLVIPSFDLWNQAIQVPVNQSAVFTAAPR